MKSAWFIQFHIFFSFLSYLLFCLAFLSAIVFLWIEHQLKHKRLIPQGWPSLMLLDSVNARAITIGFLLFTLGILAGISADKMTYGKFLIGDPKEGWTLASWCIYALIMGMRLSCTLRGKKVMLLASLAFGLILFTFMGVNFFFEGIHSVR